MTMRSLVYLEPGRVEWRETVAPRLDGALEAVVVPVASSRCSFDRIVVAGETPLRGPFGIGHEAVVRVAEIGDEVRGVEPGDLAVLMCNISCGQCDRCERGLTSHCRQVPPGSSFGLGPKWGGLFDDLVRVPFADAMLTPVPPGIDPADVAAAGDGLSVAHATMSTAMAAGPVRVAVLGSGEHGLYQVAFAVVLGAESVHYIDDSPDRRALARTLGATESTDSPDNVEGLFDVIVDAANHERWLQQAVTMLEPEGVIECLGGYFGDIALPGFPMYVGGTRMRFGIGNLGPHIKPTVDAVAEGLLRPSTLWTAQVAWDDLPAAYLEEPHKLISVRPAD